MAEIHLFTGEYPPQTGGVADYSYLLAAGLAAAGDRVHVWCPPAVKATPAAPGVAVHREMGRLSPADLQRVGSLLDGYTAPRRLLVQWVPHAYGYRSMNVFFCHWLWRRARAGDRVEIMVHEPSLPLSARSWRRSAAALVHRVMTVLLLRATRRVWVAAPEWEVRWRPYRLGRDVPFAWLPIPSNVPVLEDPTGIRALRDRFVPPGELLVGHFGTYGRGVAELLSSLVPRVLSRPGRAVLLLGRGGEEFRAEIVQRHPELASRVYATGGLPPGDTSLHLSACDLLVQLYPAGVNTRRGSMMAGLAHALPIVANAGTDTEPIWAESGAVALVPVGDEARLVERVERLLADPDERSRLGAAAGAFYESLFDVRHTVSTLRRESGTEH